MSVFDLCKKYILRSKSFYTYIVINLIVGAVAVVTPLITGLIINQFMTDVVHMDLLLILCGALAILQVVRALMNYVSSLIYANVQAHAGYELNSDTIEHIKRVPQRFFSHFDAAYYNQQINHDSNDLMIFFISSVTQVSINGLTVVVIFIILAQLNMALTFVCLALVLISAVFYWLFKKEIYNKSFELQEQNAHFFSSLQEQLDKVEFIRKHVLFEKFSSRLLVSFHELYEAVYANQKRIAQFNLGNSSVAAVAQGVIFIVGALEIVSGHLQAGYLITAVSYFTSLMASIQYFINWVQEYQEKVVCYRRLFRIWQVPEEENGLKHLAEVTSIECRNVDFSYPDNEKTSVSGLNANFAMGKIYGITGQNGCGKSTMIKLLTGMYPRDFTGDILFNGVSLSEIDFYHLRKHRIGITEQEPTILDDTIENNLTLLCDNPNHDRLNEFVDLLGLRHLIETAPRGMKTILDEDHQNLSGGEKQKIAIIRQLMKNPDVMLFDEPSSALDSRSRERFVSILGKLKESHIVIVVSHDKELIEACDELIAM